MIDEKHIKELEDSVYDLTIRVKKIESFLRAMPNVKDYIGLETRMSESEEIEYAIQVIGQNTQTSASFLQRKMSLGYSHASRLLDQLEDLGLIGPATGGKPREVLSENIKAYIYAHK